MRTTVTLSDNLYEEAKVAAARQGTSVGSVIEHALASYLSRTSEVEGLELPELPVAQGSIRAGINIDDGSELAELLDEGRPFDALR